MTHDAVALAALLVACVAIFMARRRLGGFLSVALFFVVALAYLRFGMDPPIPRSAYAIYVAVSVISVLLYATSSEAGLAASWGPIRRTMVDNSRLPVLLLALVAIPIAIAWKVRAASLPSAIPPPRVRAVHPPPPGTVAFTPPGATEAKVVDVIAGTNPLRALQATDGKAFAEKVARGKVVYYENCFYCHGDTMAADGHLAGAVVPPPISFQDAGTIAQLQETFLFWRIAKGGPGLPEESTPFDSSMPVWEKFLSEDDIWAVTLYLYDYTGYEPRANEPAGGGH
jgi:hypothetical protein